MSSSASENLRHAPEAVVKFIKRLIATYREYDGPQRRAETRSCVTVPVTIQFLDDDFRPINQPIATLTYNLSGGGIGIVHHEPITCNFIQVRLTLKNGDTMNLIASVRHCTQKGDYYQVGARFVVKWDEFGHGH
jgi:c-di-GMP-binding flagellar brake protein YcgR